MYIERIQIWPDRHDVFLTAYITPPDPNWPLPTYPRPVMIVCPGGAYLTLSPMEGAPIAAQFSTYGYQAFVLEYTVASQAGEGVDTRYPAQLIDLAKAIVLVRSNHEKWNLDPDKLAIMGFSAGGHLCASYAVHWHENWLSEAVGVSSEHLRPHAAILGYPITDYVLQENRTSPALPMMTTSNQALFGTASPSREQQEKLSPCMHVSEHTPPVYLVHASDDALVPVANSLHMAQALDQMGRPFELHIFQQGEHGFASARPMDRPWETHRDRACAAWLPLVRTWLLKQFSPDTMEQPLPSPEEFFRKKENL